MKVLLISTFVVFSQLSLGLGLIDVHVTCDNAVWLYADDQQVVGPGSGGYNNWRIINQAQVPDSTKVFGIKCVNTGGQAGLIASFDDSDNTVTDGNWRCTSTDPVGAGWLSDVYDDSGWSPAFAITQNSGNPQPWGVRPGISNEAKWIWTPGWQGQDNTVWCRKLKQEHIEATITCDNSLWFYADGKALVDSSTNDFDDWRVTKDVEVPADTRVYGIKCVDLHVVGGILASFSDGTVTDTTWRCTNTDPGPSWLSEAFDDSGWEVATKIFQNTGSVPRWNVQPDIDSDAEWIWTTGWNGEDKTVWCRKSVEEECRSSLIAWSQSGCILDSVDNCITYDQINQCGWGYRRHNYFCGPRDVRHCTYKCHKPCQHIDARITCDNSLWFYADGNVLVDSSTNDFDNWRVTKDVEVPADTRVYGIKCVDLHVVGGILASFSDGTVTDTTWRCTNTEPGQSWLSETFDDSGWQVATKIFQNTGSVPRWNVQPDIDSDAEWIWTTGWNGEDKTVWCRKFVEASVPVPDCSKYTLSGCSITCNTACSSKCSVGMVTLLWSCPGRAPITCQEECCCDRCGGSGGNQPVRVCDSINMALPLSDLPGLCPHHIF